MCIRDSYVPTNFIDNTTIGVVATNARLTKEQAHKLASISHNGLALAIRPVHTMVDGDTMFALSTGEKDGDMLTIGCAAVKVKMCIRDSFSPVFSVP